MNEMSCLTCRYWLTCDTDPDDCCIYYKGAEECESSGEST